jgi:hypothetical protein
MKKQTVIKEARANLRPIEFQIFQHLLDYVIRNRTHTTYEPVGSAIGIPHNHSCMSEFLGNISNFTKEKYDFLFSVLVYSSANQNPATGPGPGPGFANLAWDHGISISSPSWYEQEKNRIIRWADRLQ